MSTNDARKVQLRTLESMVVGALAGALARSATAPLDRVKILYQIDPSRQFSMKRAIKSGRTIWQHTGVRGLWRGNTAAVIRIAPYSAIAYTAFTQIEHILRTFAGIGGKSAAKNDEGQVWIAGMIRFWSGAAAGTVATLVTYPLDLLRARVAAHWGVEPRYASYTSALREIVRTEGAGALFNGLKPTLIGIVPYAGLSFMTYETLKSWACRRWGFEHQGDLPTLARLAMGGIAGLVAQTSTYPLHVVRRRMQVGVTSMLNSNMLTAAKGTGEVPTAKAVVVKSFGEMGVMEALTEVASREGIRGLFKGVMLTWIKGPVAVALSFTLNDSLRGMVVGRRIRVASADDERYRPYRERRANFNRLDNEEEEEGGEEGDDIYVEGGCREPSGRGGRSGWAAPKRRRGSAGAGAGADGSTAGAAAGTAATERAAAAVMGGSDGGAAIVAAAEDDTVPAPLAAVDLDSHGPGQRRARSEREPFDLRRAGETLLAGSIAGAIAKTCIAPGDRVKILFQVNANRAFSMSKAIRTARTIVQNSGVLGLWRGNGAVLLRVVPYSGLTYLCFSFYERTLLSIAADAAGGERSEGEEEGGPTGLQRRSPRAEETIRVFARFCAGSMAGATATMCTYPLDLLRARMAAHWGVEMPYRSYSDALREIVRKEGAGALFNGLKPTLIGIVPYAGLSFCLFETMKSWAQRRWRLQHERDIPTLLRLALGALAGLIAQSATCVFKRVARRRAAEQMQMICDVLTSSSSSLPTHHPPPLAHLMH